MDVWLNPWTIALILNTGLIAFALVAPKKLLTPAGYGHAWALGVLVWGTLGWQGYGVVMFYFLVGSGVTRIGMAEKEAAGIAEGRSGMRGPENVWGSALTGTLCGLGILALSYGQPDAQPDTSSPWIPLLALGYVASFATKLSDTTASEVGKAYGRRTFLITTLRPVPRGTEGAVSLEGTLAGLGASVVLALVGWGVGLVGLGGVLICVLAAFVATTVESLIGATLQSQWRWLTNEVVNLINTTVGALVAIALGVAVL
ncbi:TIGR00297 family protein [Prochlorothrix hollandica]|uniref:Membrane protein n=1 Tax=Prochlorothrix hollandica PCC 9006 = CALU 1027 TaxID=317619 RepID=A0A0M2PY87_PROHO|nr:TIGR00297 family protein [Prochlorothrix hollandica]KKJ01396.1 membrane protein [Prochlorothrix hollandica PCC 9006 = CALU 1027]